MSRWLMLPQVSTINLGAESDIYSFKCIERVMKELEPSFFYWWLRQGDEGKMPEVPNREYFYREYPAGFYQQMAFANLGALYDLFSWQRGVYPIDAVFTSRSGVAPLLQLALATFSGTPPMPVIITEPRVYGPGEDGHNLVDPTQMALRAVGYATCFGCYWSKWEKESALAAAAMYCSPATIKAAEERGFVVDALIDVAGIVKEVTRPKTPKRLLFAGRLNVNKHWDEIIESYGRILMGRKDVNVWIHGGTGAFGKMDGDGAKWHHTSERLSHVDYWGVMGSSHVAAMMSKDEGANVTAQELLVSGVVMALPKREWVRKLFHPHVYPYQVEGFRELPAMCDYLLDHYDEAYAALGPIRDMIERERSWPAFKTKFTRLWEAVKACDQPGEFRNFRKVVRELRSDAHPVVSFQSALAMVPEWAHGAPQFSGHRGMKACYNAVRAWDDHETAVPRLRPPEETDGA